LVLDETDRGCLGVPVRYSKDPARLRLGLSSVWRTQICLGSYVQGGFFPLPGGTEVQTDRVASAADPVLIG